MQRSKPHQNPEYQIKFAKTVVGVDRHIFKVDSTSEYGLSNI